MSGTRSSRPAQRWPDVMIGVLTLALLGGFGTLLFNQRKPAPAPQPQPAAATSIPASPGTVPEPSPAAKSSPATVNQSAAAQQSNNSPAAGQQSAAPQTSIAPSTAQPAATSSGDAPTAANTAAPTTAPSVPATETSGGTKDTAASTTPPAPAATPTDSSPAVAQTTEIPPVPKEAAVKPIAPPVIPKAPVPAVPAQTAPAQAAAPAPTAPSVPSAAPPAQAASQAPAPARRAGGAVATSEDRTPRRSDYRVSLGSFSTAATVSSQTAAVSALGYKVHAIDLGDQYVAQVGPFADEASARQALADIQRAAPSALLYRPKVKANETADSSDTSDSSARVPDKSDNKSTDDNETSAPAAAPSGPTYLQVGAFDRLESAQKLVGTLKDAGFAPTVSNPPDHKTTVMVGPYSGAALRRAETRLNNAGLDHFRVR